MVKTKDVAVGLAAAGAATALGFYLMKLVSGAPAPPPVPPPPAGAPPGTYRLTVKAVADSTPLAVDVTVDSKKITTEGYLDLTSGSYTVVVPDKVSDAAGNIYNYVGYA